MLSAFGALGVEYDDTCMRKGAALDGREYRDPLSTNAGRFNFAALRARIAALRAEHCRGGDEGEGDGDAGGGGGGGGAATAGAGL